jgi:hypothetical protein
MKRPLSVRGSFFVIALASLLLAAACGSGNDSHSSAPAAPPRELTAKAAGGSPGVGPLTASEPTSVDGRNHPQQVVLSDRVLIVNGVAKRTDGGRTFVDVNLTLQSRRSTTIRNKPQFFEIIGAEGDAFATQYSRSGAFYGAIDSHQSRTGTISFQIPAAATSTLRLLYRPGAASRTVIVPLTVG